MPTDALTELLRSSRSELKKLSNKKGKKFLMKMIFLKLLLRFAATRASARLPGFSSE
jgi:hypothetical protein